jgi:hypothetical protein
MKKNPKPITKSDLIRFAKFFGLLALTAGEFGYAEDRVNEGNMTVAISVMAFASIFFSVCSFIILRKGSVGK